MTETTSKALDLVKQGSSTLPEILGSLAPAVTDKVQPGFEIAKPVAVTPKIDQALVVLFEQTFRSKMLEVASKVGGEYLEAFTLALEDVTNDVVTAVERRKLTDGEVAALDAEREAMDAIEKYIKARKDAQKIMVFNHLDVEAEEQGVAKPELLDAKRHYLLPGEITTPSGDHRFTRQLSEGAPHLVVEKLEEVGDDPDFPEFDHEDYLACTTPVRVIDEAKILIHMRKKPEAVVDALAKAVQPGKVTASHYRR